MKEMRSKAVVVLVNAKNGDYQKMPRPVQEALAKPEMGASIPRMTVFDKKAENVLGSLAYKQLGDKKLMRTLENAMREYAKTGAVPGGADADDAPAEDSATEATSDDASESKLAEDGTISDALLDEWISTKGTKLTARATRYADGKLTLERENGTSVKITLDQLDADSRKKAEALIGK